jgi:hypothetical protein
MQSHSRLCSHLFSLDAKNPLSPPPRRESVNCSLSKLEDAYFYDSDDETSDEKLGTFETEQLVNAVTKITDLLRKCWGVAGAGIISSNLATNEGGLSAYFNPTVPGSRVYALFAFVHIDRFNFHLHALKCDIMILINDIAAVLHEGEGFHVFRLYWEQRRVTIIILIFILLSSVSHFIITPTIRVLSMGSRRQRPMQ